MLDLAVSPTRPVRGWESVLNPLVRLVDGKVWVKQEAGNQFLIPLLDLFLRGISPNTGWESVLNPLVRLASV